MGLTFIVCSIACNTSRVTQSETSLFPEADKGKWWILNGVFRNMQGKDIHFNTLVSVDAAESKNYAACFASIWNAADTDNYYACVRTVAITEQSYRKKFPLKIWFPANDSSGMEWSLVLKRNSLDFLAALTSKKSEQEKGYTALSASFNRQKLFAVSAISAAPQAWAINPIPASIRLSGNMFAAGMGNLQIRIFSDKELFLKRSAAAYVHWLDLDLQSGMHLSILFSTDTLANVKTETAMLWDEQHHIMARPQVIMHKLKDDKTAAASKSYPLIFSIVIPEQQLNIVVRPRMQEQEITAKKSSFWMGAVEASGNPTGLVEGKGNMYIFKQ